MANKVVTTADPPATIESMTFETALKELEEIVSRLEQGAVDLEDSISLYERGQALKMHCERKLKAAEGRLEKIVHGPQGTVSSEPVDIG
jgi:exodeoxyribonuclease VII small subunit